MPAPAPGPAVGAVAAITATQAAAGTSTVTAPLVLQTNETQEAEELVRFSRAAALNILYGILTQSPVVSPSEPQAIPRAWLSRCVNSYLATFHGRWPILHGPTLNEVTDSVPTIALIVAIDSWLQGEAKLKDQILQIHGLLVERFYRELSQCKWDPLQPWPVDLYQLCLVNIAFAFETGRDFIIRQSQMLFSLLVSCLRMHGCFHGDAVEAQRVTHFPGEFRPWIFATVERWKRIATCAFKVDACLSLLYGQPPLLRRAELDLGLTSTYAMWNSHGIMVFFDRSRSEPWTRGSYSMSQLDVRKPEEVPSGILPEDIQLCLLGMCNEVWSAKREAVLNPDLTGLKRADLAHKLYIAQEQLDTIVAESRKPLVVGGYTATIIKSYLGGEPARGANWRQEVTNRLDSCVTNIRPLLLLLTIHLHADVSKMRDVYLMPAPLQMEPAAASRTWQQNVLAIQEWALSPDGRTAVVAALQTWFAYESSLLMNASHTFDPIMFLALSAAVMVLWAWSMNEDVCVCDPTIPKIDITGVGMHLQPEVQNWIRSGTNGGGGAISYLGQPVCRCHAASRVAEWTDALARAGQTWETADVDARLFRSTLLA
ncbi:Transcription factor [Moelleriella libera RCEF 2490]|uniref:Transcription factor n=1 Tax=Moelleriella libera RCEF 2490 TaxID=1081109 RepID=A0A166PKJ2_9HYPO|nr:Transcription factor [Moelleriella libera RCEF 2490]